MSNKVNDILEAATRARFYGSITLVYHNGEVMLVRKEQTFKPGPDEPKPRVPESLRHPVNDGGAK